MMVIYVPPYKGWLAPGIFTRGYFDGCFADLGGTRSSWVVPGTWPEWAL